MFEIPLAACDPTQSAGDFHLHGCDTNRADYQNRIDKAKTYRLVGAVVGGVGVAAAVVGGVLLATSPSSASAPATASSGVTGFALAPTAQGGALVLSGRF